MQQHCDPEDLALIALGEQVDAACLEHVGTCAQCRAEVDSLREAVMAGRASGGPETLQSPPSRVWEGIREQMATEPVPLAPRTVERARPRWLGLAAAVVAGILLGGASVAVITGQNTPEQVVASAALTPLPDGPDRGGSQAEATLNRSTDGVYTVTVKATDLAGPDGFYEVWLMSPDDSGLIALGSLSPGETEATFPVPPGVDLQTFTAVDVSDEPLDGDPGHSAVSVLRGTLTT
ncbi:MAG: anti-sigma factor [Candidatus Nanopelagicales bacterium]